MSDEGAAVHDYGCEQFTTSDDKYFNTCYNQVCLHCYAVLVSAKHRQANCHKNTGGQHPFRIGRDAEIT